MRERRAGDLVGGRYRLEHELGAGGMGAVWVAVQEGLGRRVALKTLLPALARDAKAVARFKREAELAASLGHPHIVQVTDFGSDVGGAFLVMELLQGRSLADAIAAEAPMSAARLAVIGQQVLAALGAAHGAGVVHRDLKPDNVFLTEVASGGELVKLLDFGIARMALGDVGTRLTQTGQLLGTPLYMAPEQARAEEVDARTDLYALGSMLYEGATGRPPFAAPNYAALLTAIIAEAPPALGSLRPDLPPDFVAIVETAMAKDVGHRFASAEAMARALGSVRPAEPPDSDLAFASTMAAPSVDGSAATMAAPESASEPPRPGTVALKLKPLAEGSPDTTRAPNRDAATMDLPSRAARAVDRDAATRELAETPDAPASPATEPPKRDRSWMGVVATLLIVGVGVAAAYARRHGVATFADTAVASTDAGITPPPPEPLPTPMREEPVAPAPPQPIEAGPHYRDGILVEGGDAQPIPDEFVQLLLQAENDELRDCGPAPAGPVLFRFEVDERGDVASGAVGADPGSEANQCRLEVVKRLGFSPNARGRYSVRHDFR